MQISYLIIYAEVLSFALVYKTSGYCNSLREIPRFLLVTICLLFVLLTCDSNSHWEPSLPNAPGKNKIWEEASPEAKRSGS